MSIQPDHNVLTSDGQTSQYADVAKAIVADVLKRRGAGERVPDAEILAAHPGLADELKNELVLAAQIRQAFLSSLRAGPSGNKLELLTNAEIEAQLVIPAEANPDGTDEDSLPVIQGYFVLQKICRGGQATIFKAVQESTGRLVALKVVSGGPFLSSVHRARFEKEAQILAALDHPNIVSILERGRTADGSFYFAMQYVDGFELDHYWKEQVRPTISGTRAIVELFAKIADAVELAHGRGVVHRDLKPSNIRIDLRGEPRVLDFGLARLNANEGNPISTLTLTGPGQIVGSLPWASPEQAAGNSSKINACSDVYSLGVMLYQALTGDFPHSMDGTIDQVLLRIRTITSKAPSKHPKARAGVDRVLGAIVLKSLAKLAHERYHSAGVLAQDLRAWLAGNSTIAKSTGNSTRRILFIAPVLAAVCFASAALPWILSRPVPHLVADLPSFTSPVGIRLIQLPSGRYLRGSSLLEDGRNPDEHQRVATIAKPFFISANEITQKQYQAVMHSNPSDVRWRGDKFPVQNVTWNEATVFCQRLSEMEGRSYRLPREVEWEYACRANDPHIFSADLKPDQQGWYAENSGSEVKEVGGKLPNTWGLFDMHGNVAEWCADRYSADADSTADDPIIEDIRVIRGGSALSPLDECRAASRAQGTKDSSFPNVGFRIVCDLPANTKSK